MNTSPYHTESLELWTTRGATWIPLSYNDSWTNLKSGDIGTDPETKCEDKINQPTIHSALNTGTNVLWLYVQEVTTHLASVIKLLLETKDSPVQGAVSLLIFWLLSWVQNSPEQGQDVVLVCAYLSLHNTKV